MSYQRATGVRLPLLNASCTCKTRPTRLISHSPNLRHLSSIDDSSRRHPLPRRQQAFDSRRNYANTSGNGPFTPKIAVLGGGLTGLTTAYYLARDLPAGSKVVVYEAQDRWGGWLKSEDLYVDLEKRGQFSVLFERGPRTISTHSPTDRLVLHDLLGDLNLGFGWPGWEPNRYLWNSDRLVKIPSKISPEALSLLGEKIFWKGMLPSLYAYNTRKAPFPDKDMSVADYVLNLTNGNKMMVDDVASAMLHGIWGDDVYQMSVLSTMNKLFHGNRGTFSKSRKPTRDVNLVERMCTHNQSQHINLHWSVSSMIHFNDNGLEALPQALVAKLKAMPNVEMRKATGVSSMLYSDQRERIEIKDSNDKVEIFDKVISTLSPKTLAHITGNRFPTLDKFRGVTINSVNLWYPKVLNIPAGVGYLIPRMSQADNPERALGVFFDSDVLVGGKPRYDEEKKLGMEGGTKLFVLMGGHYYDNERIPGSDEAVLLAKALLQRHLGIPLDELCFTASSTNTDCIPRHHVGHNKLVTEVHADIQSAYSNRLSLIGGSFHRPGILGALRSAYEIANDVVGGNFWSTGLEDWTEERMLDPRTTMVDPDDVPWRPLTSANISVLNRHRETLVGATVSSAKPLPVGK